MCTFPNIYVLWAFKWTDDMVSHNILYLLLSHWHLLASLLASHVIGNLSVHISVTKHNSVLSTYGYLPLSPITCCFSNFHVHTWEYCQKPVWSRSEIGLRFCSFLMAPGEANTIGTSWFEKWSYKAIVSVGCFFARKWGSVVVPPVNICFANIKFMPWCSVFMAFCVYNNFSFQYQMIV